MKNNELIQASIVAEAEREMIGIILNSPKLQSTIVAKLFPNDFYTQPNAEIYGYIYDMYLKSKDINIKSVCDYIATQKNNASQIVNELNQINLGFSGNDTYLNLIELIFKNSMIKRFDNTMKSILSERENYKDAEEYIQSAQSKILNLKTSLQDDKIISIEESLNKLVDKLIKRQDEGEQLSGVTSGFLKLDEMTNGFQNGDFIILAARPSMGKTAFALNLAVNASKIYNALFFSLEMPEEQITQRILSSESMVNLNIIRSGHGEILENSMSKIISKKESLSNHNLYIDDSSSLTLLEIQSRLRKAKHEKNIDICFIDYLQLISPSTSGNDNRQNEISKISQGLKKIARELNIPIVCLSQLSRNVEKREEKRPMMSDLRDSGAIEQDADIIMFLYRESYYESKVVDTQNNNPTPDVTDLIISKHRNGPIGTIKFIFSKENGKFVDDLSNEIFE